MIINPDSDGWNLTLLLIDEVNSQAGDMLESIKGVWSPANTLRAFFGLPAEREWSTVMITHPVS